MSPERLSGETLLQPDGDIVPPDDIPDAEDVPTNEDIIEDMTLASEVERAEAQEELSDAYRGVVALIEAGIEKSKGYNHLKVEHDGELIRLGKFLATVLFRLDLSAQERQKILDTYIPIDLAHEAAQEAEAAEESFEDYYKLYDDIEAKNPGGAAEIRQLTTAEARRRGIPVPPEQ